MGMWDTGCGMGCRIGVQHGAVGLEMWDGVQGGGWDVGCRVQDHPSPGERLGKSLQAQQDEQGPC